MLKPRNDFERYLFVLKKLNYKVKYTGLRPWIERGLLPESGFKPKRCVRASSHKLSISPETYGALLHNSIMRLVNKPGDSPGSMAETAQRILTMLQSELRLRPVRAEARIVHAQWQMGTQIDLLCLTEQDELHVIELKTSQRGFEVDTEALHYTSDDPMFSHMRNNILPNSEYTHHQLQLGASILTLNRYYKLVRPASGGILRYLADGELSYCRVEPWALDERMYSSHPHPLVCCPERTRISRLVPLLEHRGMFRGKLDGAETPVLVIEGREHKLLQLHEIVQLSPWAPPFCIAYVRHHSVVGQLLWQMYEVKDYGDIVKRPHLIVTTYDPPCINMITRTK